MIATSRVFVATSVLATLAAVAGCMTPPTGLDQSRAKATEAGRYQVVLVAPTPAPAVNQLHAWKIRLATPDGRPVTEARFVVGGGMPQHGHGYPTQPRVTRELEDGTYLLEGMKFSMTGWWELKLGIQAPAGADQVAFNIVVDPGTRIQ
jgi:hypothetical protein